MGAIIETPVINSPYKEPDKYFRFSEKGITNEIVAGRRPSSYYMPIAQPRKKGKQLVLDTWTEDGVEENQVVNEIRVRVKAWRERGIA